MPHSALHVLRAGQLAVVYGKCRILQSHTWNTVLAKRNNNLRWARVASVGLSRPPSASASLLTICYFSCSQENGSPGALLFSAAACDLSSTILQLFCSQSFLSPHCCCWLSASSPSLKASSPQSLQSRFQADSTRGKGSKAGATFLLLATPKSCFGPVGNGQTAGKEAESLILADKQAGAEGVTVWVWSACPARGNGSGGKQIRIKGLGLKNFSCQRLVWLLEWGARLPAVWGSDCPTAAPSVWSRALVLLQDLSGERRCSSSCLCPAKGGHRHLVLGQREGPASGIGKSQVIPNSWIQKSPSLGRKDILNRSQLCVLTPCIGNNFHLEKQWWVSPARMHFWDRSSFKLERCGSALCGETWGISSHQSAPAHFAYCPVGYCLADHIFLKSEFFVKIHFSLGHIGWWDANVMHGVTVDTACVVEGNT